MAAEGHGKIEAGTRPPVGAGRQTIEGNPPTQDEIMIFAMFERKEWTPEQRRYQILSLCGIQRS